VTFPLAVGVVAFAEEVFDGFTLPAERQWNARRDERRSLNAASTGRPVDIG
jgi:hypothetical protein